MQDSSYRFCVCVVEGRGLILEGGWTLTLQHRIWLQQLVLDILKLTGLPSDSSDILHDQFARLCLAGPALPREDDSLVLTSVPQIVPGPVSQGVAAEKEIIVQSTKTWP